jgi:hypothetical protein
MSGINLRIVQNGLEIFSRWPVFRGDLTGTFGVALFSNLMKEGFRLASWTLLNFGILVMPIALAAAVVALVLVSLARERKLV